MLKQVLVKSLQKTTTNEQTFTAPLLPSLRTAPPFFRLFFRSSGPRPNILKSDFAGLVLARNADTRINFTILGNDWDRRTFWFSASWATLESAFPCSMVEISSGGRLHLAHSIAEAWRGYSVLSAPVKVGLNILSNCSRTSKGTWKPTSSSEWPASRSRCRSSRRGLTKPGQRAAAI